MKNFRVFALLAGLVAVIPVAAAESTVAGMCGPAHDIPTVSAPSSGLCFTGNSTSPIHDLYQWSWLCEGTGEAKNSQDFCTAPKMTNGVCGANHYSCTAGTPNSFTNYADTHWAWTCDGWNGGLVASCMEIKVGGVSQLPIPDLSGQHPFDITLNSTEIGGKEDELSLNLVVKMNADLSGSVVGYDGSTITISKVSGNPFYFIVTVKFVDPATETAFEVWGHMFAETAAVKGFALARLTKVNAITTIHGGRIAIPLP